MDVRLKAIKQCSADIRFSGTHFCRLDTKNRFTLPKRSMLSIVEPNSSFYCFISINDSSIDKSLFLFPEDVWTKLRPRTNNKLFESFFSGSYKVQLDDSGRIPLSSSVLKFMGWSGVRDLVIKGIGNCFEILSNSEWNKQCQKS